MSSLTYITTSIAYPNAKPHIGHALELVQADFLARYYQAQGNAVQLLTGVDEHGLKIQQAASAAGISPAEFVAEQSNLFQQLADGLSVKYTRFIHTTDADHLRMAQALWRRCLAVGDIYRKPYRAWYNVKEETFLGSVEEFSDPAVFGIDPRFIEQIDEENYFFRLSRYQQQIENLIRSGELKIVPESRGHEMLNFMAEHGLEDISISRDISRLAWGVPVPEDSHQVMYVWFDALTNYLTAAATLSDKGEILPGPFWPPTIHCVGYDIQRFHALIWPAMLLSAGLALPHEILVHGFITDEHGQKMSKSIGNVIDPIPLLQHVGSDALRWYLLKELSTTVDTRVRSSHIDEIYTADLANTLGNLVSRLANMTIRYCEGVIPETISPLPKLTQAVTEKTTTYNEAVEARNIQAALQAVIALLTLCNQLIEEYKPWQLAKDSTAQTQLRDLLASLWLAVRAAIALLKPALPDMAGKLSWLLEGQKNIPAENLILFPRLDD